MHLTREQLAQKNGARESVIGAVLRSARASRAVSEASDLATAQALFSDHVGRTVRFTLSTSARASDDHTIAVAGWDTEEYERAPHVFWQHDHYNYHARSGARIGDSFLIKDPDALRGVCAFYTRDFSEALDGGFSWAIGEIAATRGIRASVAFTIVEATLAPDDVRKNAPWALDISRARLTEWSLVNFGADSEAISEGRALGVDVAPIAAQASRALDTAPSKEAEAIYAAASDKIISVDFGAIHKALQGARTATQE